MRKNSFNAILIAMLLITSMTAVTSFSASAHTPPITVPTWAYLSVMPNPIGIGQEAFVNFWIDKAPPTAQGPYGDRFGNFTVTVTKPDGTVQKMGPYVSDDTGGAHDTYTPDQLGNYTFQFTFGGQTLAGDNPPPSGNNNVMIGDYYAPSTSHVVTLNVQQTQIPSEPQAPLPTGYWQRPIYAENLDWYQLSGNWLGLAAVGFTRITGQYSPSGNFNPYTTAPTTAHILWTRELAPGGIIGGEFGGDQYGSAYYATSQYEPKFGGIIINGVLYYQLLPGASTNPAGWEAVDIRTGQQIWFANTTEPLLTGQVVKYISPNQFGGLSYLWSTQTTVKPNTGSTYGMYDAMTGNYILSIVNGTSFKLTEDDNGNLLGYYVNSSRANAYNAPTINLWNSTKCIIDGTNGAAAWQWRPRQGAQIPFSLGIEWSKPIATTMNNEPISPGLSLGPIGSGVLLMTATPTALTDPRGTWQPGWRWIAGYSAMTGERLWGPLNETEVPYVRLDTHGISESMWFEFDHENLVWTGHDANTGKLVWTAEPYDSPPWAYFINYASIVAYDTLYACDFGGQVHAYDIKTGEKLWQFSTGSSGYSTPYGIWPLVHVECVAGGEVFLSGGHTYSPPLFVGAKVYALNATTGEEVWSVSSFDDSNGASAAIADGIFVKPNAYDNRLYAYGQGLSSVTVSAPNVAVPMGTPLVITGTVTDQSAGQTCLGVPAKGTPAISDASMSAWMEYLYMQQPKPDDATGVPVTLSVLDANGNFREIGTATSNVDGTYSYVWTPDIPGKYTLTAAFAGSGAYFGSSASTAFYANESPTPVPTQTGVKSMSDQYFIPAVVAIIVVIIVVGAILGLLLVRKKP